MQKETLYDNWEMTCVQTGEKKQVTVPCDAMLDEKRSADNPGMHHIGWFAGHDYVFSRRLHLTGMEA